MISRFPAALIFAALLSACAAPLPVATSPEPLSLRMNHEGAEALLTLLGQSSVTDEEIDRVFGGLNDGTMSWEAASEIMFTGTGPGLYFVGYEMTKAIDARFGPERIAALMVQHPAAFFATYIDLYRACPSCAPATFSAATERAIAARAPEPDDQPGRDARPAR